MQYEKGLPPQDGPVGDYRGHFGIGRPAHGSDPKAHYVFGAPLPRSGAAPTVAVKDLTYELDENGTACLTICVSSPDGELKFDLTFPLQNQTGSVDATIEAAHARLIGLLECTLEKLKAEPLERL